MYSVLCIDDDPIFLRLISEFLRRAEFSPRCAPNGAAGMRMFEADPADLVITDLRMPIMSGFEVLEHIIRTSPDTPVIVLSGTQTVQDAVEAMRSGAWDYMTKPVESFTLLDLAIHKALERAELLKDNRRYREHLEVEVKKRTKELESEIRGREELETALRESLKEKELLLKEIHHRVKNNLQIISSLLSLQTSQIDDCQYRSMFIQSQNRIKSMAIVHEELYESNNFSKINFKSYVRTLITYLSGVYEPAGRHVNFTIEADEIQLPIINAIPCGLILNELVTNAYKHAFTDRNTGTIRIVIRQTGTCDDKLRIHLTVADNGKGLPRGFETGKRSSLGMQLIRTLVAQIHGELSVVPSPGAEFTVTFQPEASKKSTGFADHEQIPV